MVRKPGQTILNRSHPLAQGLVIDVPLSEGHGGKTVEQVSGLTGNFVANAKWVATPIGYCLNTPAGTDYIQFDYVPNLNAELYLTIQILYFVRADTSGGNFIRKGVNNNFSVNLDDGCNGIGWFLADSGGTKGFGVNSYTGTYSKWYNTIVTYADRNNTASRPSWNRRRYDDLTYTPSLTNSCFNVPHNGTPLADDNTCRISAAGGNADVALVRVWKRILTQHEIRSISLDPWQVYKRPSIISQIQAMLNVPKLLINQAINRASTY